MDTKQKFVRLKEYDQVIIFPSVMEHSTFKHLNPISAGFCYINPQEEVVRCFGESFSLGINSLEDDTMMATKQVFGIDAALKTL